MAAIGIKHENLDLLVYRQLKSMIIDRDLLPGSKIYQDRIASELEVSRTPLMAALKKLEQEKLVKAIPRRGFFVREFSRRELIEIFEIREVMEGLSARKAAMNITDEQIKILKKFFKDFKGNSKKINLKQYAREDRKFHNYIVEIAGQPSFLSEMFDGYNVIALSYQAMQMEGLFRHPRETLQEHIALIEKICEKDAQAAETLAREHLHPARQNLLQELQLEESQDLQKQLNSIN